jgi:hypothetical protein
MLCSSQRLFAAGILAGAALVSLAGAPQAATFTTGDIQVNLGGGGVEVPIYLDAATDTTTGTGHVGSQTGLAGTPVVTFTTNVNSDFANGFATIKPSDDPVINSLTFSVPAGFFFTDLVFHTQNPPPGNVDGDILITALNGITEVGQYGNDAISSGLQEWLTVAINGALFTSIVITSDRGFAEFKQFSISGLVSCGPTGCAPPPGLVPIPGALPLFASGMGLLGFLGWRRRKRTAQLPA